MSERKVIEMFKRHGGGLFPADVASGGEFAVSPDGFHYLTFRQNQEDAHGEEELVSLAHKKHYLVKMIEHHRDAIRVNLYHVEGERLTAFLQELDKRPGALLEIQPFFPETTA
ncbi:MAG: hypothetical protein IPK79_09415 [Vampirovibrionales bacterium]|nr:hypothetical protein [Vampirovibrionales bacterium]